MVVTRFVNSTPFDADLTLSSSSFHTTVSARGQQIIDPALQLQEITNPQLFLINGLKITANGSLRAIVYIDATQNVVYRRSVTGQPITLAPWGPGCLRLTTDATTTNFTLQTCDG